MKNLFKSLIFLIILVLSLECFEGNIFKKYDVQCTTYINYLQKLPNEVVLNVKTNY